MQRLSSLGFGTGLGRFLTRFAAVPFGGAYVALAGVREAWEMILGAAPPPADSAAEDAAALGEAAAESGFHLTSPELVLAVGLFLLFLVNSASFRRAVGLFFTTFYDVFRALVVEPIRWVVQWPLLQQILHSRLFTAVFRFLIKPLIWTGVAWSLLPSGQRDWGTSAGTSVSVFLAVNLLLNSRLGRTTEEVVVDWIVQGWHRFGLRVIMGLFWLVVDLFRGVLETVERLMYAVDEWLRFKSGESSLSLLTKTVMGLLWFSVSYVLRFAINVLIEPQINPIKHFPVVTVSHKLLLPLIPHFTGVLIGVGMEKALAGLTAGAVITSIPGLFGFLVYSQ
jgi:hypothetical protein